MYCKSMFLHSRKRMELSLEDLKEKCKEVTMEVQ